MLIDLMKLIIGVCIVAGLSSINFSRYANKFMQIGQVAAAESNGMNEDALLLKCRSLLAEGRRADMYNPARRGYNTFHSNEWRYLYGMACAFRYEDNNDYSALIQAERLFRDYTRKSPYDPQGHVQLGWSLSHLDRRAEAKHEFKKALELDPNNRMAKSKLRYVQP
ncbi:MAG: tetratricopeptide repeat protein [Armatimonadota bacterium]